MPDHSLAPNPRDESPHPPGDEPFWNESWYFDGVSADPEIGVYVRLGNVPNRGSCLYTVAVVRPGKPTVMGSTYCRSIASISSTEGSSPGWMKPTFAIVGSRSS